MLIEKKKLLHLKNSRINSKVNLDFLWEVFFGVPFEYAPRIAVYSLIFFAETAIFHMLPRSFLTKVYIGLKFLDFYESLNLADPSVASQGTDRNLLHLLLP